jgi:hypothetical protein
MRNVLILLLVVGCAEDVSEEVPEVVPALAANALAANALTSNALAANALAANALAANALAANALAANGISSGPISDPTVALALEDPSARIYMKYLVECALAPGQEVTFTSRAIGELPSFKGMLGLCPAWQLGPPDQGCRERVSACLLARNNSFEFSVPFSMRGQKSAPNPMTLAANPLQLSNVVPAHDHVPGTNTPVKSLALCELLPAFMLPEDRDCNWSVGYIGVCSEQSMVTIGAGQLAQCSGELLGSAGSNDEMLRVCAGTSACDSDSISHIASVNDPCGNPAPMVEFICPQEGRYAVMKGTANIGFRRFRASKVGSTMITGSLCTEIVTEDPALASCAYDWLPDCQTRAETVCRYPATETRVFRWKEGAFYGDIFGNENRSPKKPQMRVLEHQPNQFRIESRDTFGVWHADGGELSRNFTGIVYPSMYSCSSRNWVDPIAYMRFRVCAGPGASGLYTKNCAARYVGPCVDVCKTEDLAPPGDFDFAGCKNGVAPRVWEQPMTTFIAGPCDLVPGACGTVLPTPIFNW